MSLRHSYTLIAPFYDAIVSRATSSMRRASLQNIGDVSGKTVLLAGYGTGLDNPYLPEGARYIGLDLTPAMLNRAAINQQNKMLVELRQGDVMQMPFDDHYFDIIVLHLILAVVSDPVKVLHESARTLKPGGKILLLDKFIRPGQLAIVRRTINVFLRHIATRTDVVFEEVLAQAPELKCIEDTPCMPGGWFRRIIMEKPAINQNS